MPQRRPARRAGAGDLRVEVQKVPTGTAEPASDSEDRSALPARGYARGAPEPLVHMAGPGHVPLMALDDADLLAQPVDRPGDGMAREALDAALAPTGALQLARYSVPVRLWWLPGR